MQLSSDNVNWGGALNAEVRGRFCFGPKEWTRLVLVLVLAYFGSGFGFKHKDYLCNFGKVEGWVLASF